MWSIKARWEVFTETITIAKSSTPLPIIQEQVSPHTIRYMDSFTVCAGLDVSEFHRQRVDHSTVFVTKRGHHINGSEKSWSKAKRHLRQFNGFTPDRSTWFLRECQWRFNNGSRQQLLRQLKCWCTLIQLEFLDLPAL